MAQAQLKEDRMIGGLLFIDLLNSDETSFVEASSEIQENFHYYFKNAPKHNPKELIPVLLSLKHKLKVACEKSIKGSEKYLENFIKEYWELDSNLSKRRKSVFIATQKMKDLNIFFGRQISLELLLISVGRSLNSIRRCKNCNRYFVTIHLGAEHCSPKCKRDYDRNAHKNKYNDARRKRYVGGVYQPISYFLCQHCESRIFKKQLDRDTIQSGVCTCPNCKHNVKIPIKIRL
jgi:uncharacterized protein YlaI